MGMEAVFVPRTPESEEDDGWLMTFVTDMGTQTSEMAIFGAQDVRAGPVATIRLPQRVPLGFHGNWIADADLKEARP
jgi:carotenoid cleavage dioxygenase